MTVIDVAEGDITTLRVDAIVNAANCGPRRCPPSTWSRWSHSNRTPRI